MCQCNPRIKTPFCGHGECRWTHSNEPSSIKLGVTVMELIEELYEFAKIYGPDAEVTVLRDDDSECSPTLSGGPCKDGNIRVRIL